MSVPFNLEEYEGLAEVEGVARFEDDVFILEFQTKDAVFGVVKSGVKEVRVPLADLMSIELDKKFFGAKLRVRAKSMKSFADCPGNRSGEVELGIKRKHRVSAEELVMDVSLRINERRMDAAMRDLDALES